MVTKTDLVSYNGPTSFAQSRKYDLYLNIFLTHH